MAFTNKPTYIPEWATDDVYNAETETYNVVTPDAAKIELGWDAYEKPPRNYMNWLQRGNYQWIEYFEQFFDDDNTFRIDAIEPNGASGVTIDGFKILNGSASGTLTGNVTGNLAGNVTGHADSILETGTDAEVVHKKTIKIGDWDMDSTASITKAHGLTASKIRKVDAVIINDDSTIYMPIDSYYNYNAPNGCISYQATNIVLSRIASGAFDSTDYNSTSFNRGWITIEYVD